MFDLLKGKYSVRLATNVDDVAAAQALRYKAFIDGANTGAGLDSDDFDSRCAHVLIEECTSRNLVCCFRMLDFPNGAAIGVSYSAQFYELAGLGDFKGPMVELGRFCVDPAYYDPDILRLAWAAMTQYVDSQGVELMFGCTSFHGLDAEAYSDAFALLYERHLAPKQWLPKVRAPNVIPFSQKKNEILDTRNAMRVMPPLLKTYLMMGGWVSDHAVVDQKMNTLHVFTGIEIKAIPPARKRLLRAVVG